jgi:hypothetical protein
VPGHAVAANPVGRATPDNMCKAPNDTLRDATEGGDDLVGNVAAVRSRATSCRAALLRHLLNNAASSLCHPLLRTTRVSLK